MLPVLTLLAVAMLVYPSLGQDNKKIPISFLPPPLETATYSLGIYNAKSGQLVRRLQEGATQDAFTVGLNGLITNWDGKDEAGKPVLPGKYAVRGYAVGELKVAGEEIFGNDWTADDEELRIAAVKAMVLVPADNGLVIVGTTPGDKLRVARYGGAEGKLLWQRSPAAPASHARESVFLTGETLLVDTAGSDVAYRLSDGADAANPVGGFQGDTGARDTSRGKDDTGWNIDAGVLTQYSAQGKHLRTLVPKEGDPLPIAVAASKDADRLYLLESAKNWQRVRGLSWVETKEENGKPVSTWQTFFERNIRPPDPTLGLDEPGVPVEISLVENPLDPGKPQKIRLQAKVDDMGSYLVAADGLRLRRISQRANLKTAKVVKGKSANSLTFFQNDGAAWDEFSIEGVKNMMAFDAGEIDMTADGEKTHPEKAAEPPDL